MRKLQNWENVLLKQTDTLSKAIFILTEGAMRIALVVDEYTRLLGTITDGDIRRALLSHHGMEAVVTKVMKKHPITALESDDNETILAMMKSKDLLQIPVLNSEGCVVRLETLQKLIDGIKYDNPIFLMAGGFGTRLYPLTKDTPKPMLKVGNKPILETIFNQFVESGFHDFYISIHYKAEMVREHFGDGSDWGVDIKYVHEDTPLGTAGALGLLPKELSQLPIIMMNGDLLTKVNFEHLLSFHQEQKGLATMCVREYDFQVPYGVIETSEQQVISIVEKPIHNFFVNAGIYVLEPEFIQQVDGLGYLDMPNLLDDQINKGAKINSFPIHEYWLDIGRIEEYERAKRDAIE